MNSSDIYRYNRLGAGLSRIYSPVGTAALGLMLFGFAVLFTPTAQAGGREFAAGGARGLGRGGAAFLRADDPYVMVLNPALLADLPDDMALISGLLVVPDACFQPPGSFAWATDPKSDVVVLDKKEGPLYLGAEKGDVNAATGKKLTPYRDEPLPQSCYSGGMRASPLAALSAKLGDKLGIGIGFLPPDNIAVDFWGNGDGTVDTPKGKRPDIAAYSASFTNTTYFSLIGAMGYRLAPWLRLGLGLKWTMIVTNSIGFSNDAQHSLSPADMGRSQNYGKDLFIPGFTASVHAVPIDALDLAAGFRWEDRIRMNEFKLDTVTRIFSYGDEFVVRKGDQEPTTVYSSPRYPTYNIPGKVVAPPILVPQLTFGIRFADRIRPRYYATRKRVAEDLRDSMSDERWDIEANAIYYFNSAYDRTLYSNDGTPFANYTNRDASGFQVNRHGVGPCVQHAADGETCTRREIETKFAGKNQLGLRLGGDINIIPGLFTVRAGASWDSRGINPDYASPQNMNFERLGLHAGLTVRIAKNTDLSVAYAHFFFETIEVQLSTEGDATIPNLRLYAKTPEQAAKYHIKVDYDENGKPVLSKLDGVAKGTYTSGGTNRSWPYVNAGKYTYQMDVAGISLAQHF